ncbi:DUF4190 domain-containing protein [Leptolyngbya sp. 7M]|uniref:DUF4190 domain-containing protein n=1 Tax=Leptolyngbya sp. 7M TaxID=2812896 RepID=UPI001B8B7C79|nr:DUF4190 domain-containing protein [Leptolyngbya sp. 7M]QYO62476.1 DUF4190 domain-containing protein [Leptolyngbya sp. 7M]
MKRCPTCDKTFDDVLKFCQLDGTPLVDAAPAEEVDPFKTMVASPSDIAAAMSSLSTQEEPAEKIEEPVLEIPEAFDSGKTQVVSEAELRAEMAKADAANEQVIDVPPISDTPAAEVEPLAEDKFIQTSPPIPSPFGDAGQQGVKAPDFGPSEPEPISASVAEAEPPSPFSQAEPPSPFSQSSAEPEISEPAKPEAAYNPFEHSAPQAKEPLAQAEWTPPAAQESSMQNPQNFGQNPAASAAGPSSTLSIISLVLGILSLVCCTWYIVGLAAIITGFMARSKANNDPANYGGAGMATIGIVLGFLSFIIGTVILVLYLFTGVFAGVMQGIQ